MGGDAMRCTFSTPNISSIFNSLALQFYNREDEAHFNSRVDFLEVYAKLSMSPINILSYRFVIDEKGDMY